MKIVVELLWIETLTYGQGYQVRIINEKTGEIKMSSELHPTHFDATIDAARMLRPMGKEMDKKSIRLQSKKFFCGQSLHAKENVQSKSSIIDWRRNVWQKQLYLRK